MSFGKNMMKHKTSGGDGGGGTDPIGLFKQFDMDGDGVITENDFVLTINKIGMGSVGEGAARMAFKKVDKNGNGKLDISEAIRLYEVVKELIPNSK